MASVHLPAFTLSRCSSSRSALSVLSGGTHTFSLLLWQLATKNLGDTDSVPVISVVLNNSSALGRSRFPTLSLSVNSLIKGI